MCLCKLIIFTFSNKIAFRRLRYKLQKLDKELKHGRYPEGTTYIIISHSFTPEERDKFSYEELLTLANLRVIQTEHIHFLGWCEYKAMRKRVGDNDVFGKVEIKVL